MPVNVCGCSLCVGKENVFIVGFNRMDVLAKLGGLVNSVSSGVFAEDMIIAFHKSAANLGGRALHGRDVFNEKPNTEDALVEGGAEGEERAVLPRGAVLHTSRGDITLRLFPDEARLDQGLFWGMSRGQGTEM